MPATHALHRESAVLEPAVNPWPAAHAVTVCVRQVRRLATIKEYLPLSHWRQVASDEAVPTTKLASAPHVGDEWGTHAALVPPISEYFPGVHAEHVASAVSVLAP